MKDREIHVLVAPLDWGLGHATRCIPVINQLLQHNIQVTLCASGYGKILLEERYPELPLVVIPGFDIRYPANGSMAVSILLQFPKILAGIRKEHSFLDQLISEKKITHVISDNRYGFYSEKVKTAFMTHQVRISGGNGLKFIEPLLFRMNKKRIENFNELWIPDDPDVKISGVLSNSSGINIPVRHTGILSRFVKPASATEKKYDCIAILSGPEPQRTIFEFKVMQFFQQQNKKCLVILGQPGNPVNTTYENITVMATIRDDEFSGLLHPETLLICRPGYSTIMDLAVLGHRNVLFVPTPGQTEQEYLAKDLRRKYNYCTALQAEDPATWEEITPGREIAFRSKDEILQKTIGAFLSPETKKSPAI